MNSILKFKIQTDFFWDSLNVDKGKLVRLGASGDLEGIPKLW